MGTMHERIKAELKRLKLSIRNAAEPLGVSKSQVAKLLRGEADPDSDTLAALCELTGRTADYFVTGRDVEPGLTEDERYLLWLVRDLELDRREAARRLTREGPAKSKGQKYKPHDEIELQPETDEGAARPSHRGSA